MSSEAMNYYEEFGLSRNASAEQIRDAYRALMRLLHPDHHSDPELQRVADLQAKKLNQIHAVLSDPERRRRYDQELDEGYERSAPIIIHAPPPRRRMGLNRSSIPWLMAVVAFGILLIWMASRPTPVEPGYNSGASIAEAPALPASKPERELHPSPPPPAPPAPKTTEESAPVLLRPTASQLEAEQLRQRLAKLELERDTALAQLEHARSVPKIIPAPANGVRPLEQKRLVAVLNEPAPEIKPDPRRAGAPPGTGSLMTLQPAAAPVKIEQKRPPLLGEWFYRPATMPQTNKQLYPPEFIEAVINEDNGQVRGTYRARYKVTDRPVSPDVSFYFAGKLTGDSGSLPWNGSGGSRGEVTFKLMADHSLRVDWVASQLGALGFYRGTAILVRRAE